MRAWHFLPDDGRLRFYRPSWQTLLEPDRPGVGDTLLRNPWRLRPRFYGLHACPNILDALQYARGSILCRVELSERIITDGDLCCASARTILAKCEDLEEAQKAWHLFACWAASRAVALCTGTDPPSHNLIAAKRDWIRNEFPDRGRRYRNLLKAKAELYPFRNEKGARAAWAAASDKAGWLVARQSAREAAKAVAWTIWSEEEATRTAVEGELGADLLAEAIGDAAEVTPSGEAWFAERDAQSLELERLAHELLGDAPDLVPEISRRTPFSYGADRRSDSPEPGGMAASVDVDTPPCPGALENYRVRYRWKHEIRRGTGGCQMLWRGVLSDAQIAALSFDLDAIELLFSGPSKDDKEILLDFSDLGALESIGNGGHTTAPKRELMDADELDSCISQTGDLNEPADEGSGEELGNIEYNFVGDYELSDWIHSIIESTNAYSESDQSIESFEEDEFVYSPSTTAVQDERRLDLLARAILEFANREIGDRQLIQKFKESCWQEELTRRLAGPARARQSTTFQYQGDIPEGIRAAWITALKNRSLTQLSGKAADLLEEMGWTLNAAARRTQNEKRELHNDLIRSRYDGSRKRVTIRFVLDSIVESDKPPGDNWFCYSIAEIKQSQWSERRTAIVGYRQGTFDEVKGFAEMALEALRKQRSSRPGQEPETVSHSKRLDQRLAREAPTTYWPERGRRKPWNPNLNRPLLPPGKALDGRLQAEIYRNEPDHGNLCDCTYRGGPCERHSACIAIETPRKFSRHD